MKMTNATLLLCRLSLSFLWLFTGATSFWWGRDIGYAVLAHKDLFADICIDAGSLLDVSIGVWLLTNFKLRWCYLFQIIVIITYTILLTFIDASFWLHPFGSLTKNIPILALLFVLLQSVNVTSENPPQ